MIGLSFPALPSSMHDIVSHAWPLLFLVLILMLGKRFFKERRKLMVAIILCFIPLVIWGPLLFKGMDEMLGEPDGKVYSYMRYDYRVFTDQKGRKITATILDVSGDEVTIRRKFKGDEVVDGKKFKDYENPIADYSAKDQKYIRSWKSRR